MKLKVENRYGIIPNSILNNKDLSFKAKGLFGYIQSKPENWDFSINRIKFDSKESRDSINNGLKELETFGFLKRRKYQNDKGHWEIEYILKENPIVENPNKENPTKEITQTNKKRNTNKEINNKDLYVLSKDNTEQSSEIVKIDKRDLDIDLIIEALKECNLGLLDDTIKKQRQYGKLIKDKLLKLKGFNGRYVEFIRYVYENSDEYRRQYFRSAEKFYYNLASIIAGIKIKAETKKKPLVC